VLDGEIACVDDSGRSVFNDLLFRRRECVFFAFDLLFLNGDDLRGLPLIERKVRLKRLLRSKRSPVLYVDHIEADLSKAVRDEILTVNRASNMGRFPNETSTKAAAKKIKPLTPAELPILFAKAQEKDFVLYAFFFTAVLTGLRISEMIGLQWGDIDIVNRQLHVTRAVTHRRLETPKSHYIRSVDLSEDRVPVFEQLRTYRQAQWLKKGAPMPNGSSRTMRGIT
jgi:integrase